MNVGDIASLEERLLMPRTPWRTFTDGELDHIASCAWLHHNDRLLEGARREVRRRDRVSRSSADRPRT